MANKKNQNPQKPKKPTQKAAQKTRIVASRKRVNKDGSVEMTNLTPQSSETPQNRTNFNEADMEKVVIFENCAANVGDIEIEDDDSPPAGTSGKASRGTPKRNNKHRKVLKVGNSAFKAKNIKIGKKSSK